MPTSVTGFAYQRPRQRQGSITSFTYFQDQDESPQYSDDEEAVLDVSDEEDGYANGNGHDPDLEAQDGQANRRKSSGRIRTSSDAPLLRRHDSARSDTQEHDDGGSFSRKLYIEAEDLTMVIAGFTTSSVGFLLYLAICILTAGIGYLVFRWAPRLYIRMIGVPAPLRKCAWVVVEVSHGVAALLKRKAKSSQNQWGEFTVHDVASEEYGYAMSTVFVPPSREKLNGNSYYNDPELKVLRYLDYRYMRLIYHPQEDKFVLNNNWWDPQWTDVKAMREGLDSEERDPRDQVFGKNVIEIREKTIPQLLMDEVSMVNGRYCLQLTIRVGFSPVLHFPDRQPHTLVYGRVLLLCCSHILHISIQYYDHHHRNTIDYATSARDLSLRMRCQDPAERFLACLNLGRSSPGRCLRSIGSVPHSASLR